MNKPYLVDRYYIQERFAIQHGKLRQLVADGEIKIIKSYSHSRHKGTRKAKGDEAIRPRIFYVLKSVEDYIKRLAHEQGVEIKID